MGKNQSEILSANELHKSVQEYSEILSPNIINYLNSLIELEFSALNQEKFSETDMTRLNELTLYRKIAIYNIYNRILNASKYNTIDEPHSIRAVIEGQEFFAYQLGKNYVSNIVLNQKVINLAERQEQITRLYQELEEVKKSKETSIIRKAHLGVDNATKIRYIEELIKELETRSTSAIDCKIRVLSDAQENYISQILGNEGLQVTQDFVEKPAFSQTDIAIQSINFNPYPKKVERALTKKFVKTYPHTTITKFIKYY